MTLPLRTLAALELCALRLLLPRWFVQHPLDVLMQRLTRAPLSSASVPESVLERDLLRAEYFVERATSLPKTCLYRSLARYAVLRRMGHPARFVMGLRSRPGTADEGHAWVEIGGRPVAEAQDTSLFRVTFAYPPAPNDDTLGER